MLGNRPLNAISNDSGSHAINGRLFKLSGRGWLVQSVTSKIWTTALLITISFYNIFIHCWRQLCSIVSAIVITTNSSFICFCTHNICIIRLEFLALDSSFKSCRCLDEFRRNMSYFFCCLGTQRMIVLHGKWCNRSDFRLLSLLPIRSIRKSKASDFLGFALRIEKPRTESKRFDFTRCNSARARRKAESDHCTRSWLRKRRNCFRCSLVRSLKRLKWSVPSAPPHTWSSCTCSKCRAALPPDFSTFKQFRIQFDHLKHLPAYLPMRSRIQTCSLIVAANDERWANPNGGSSSIFRSRWVFGGTVWSLLVRRVCVIRRSRLSVYCSAINNTGGDEQRSDRVCRRAAAAAAEAVHSKRRTATERLGNDNMEKPNGTPKQRKER